MEKEMKTKSKISGHIIRSVVYAVFLSVAFIAFSSAFDSPSTWYKSAVATGSYGSAAKSPSQPRAFSFAERVAFQRAIEDVYWRHGIWPRTRGENLDPKPSLDAVMSQAQLEKKVASYLHDSVVLQDYWQRPSLLSNYSSVGNVVRTGPVELRYAKYKTAVNTMISAQRATVCHDIARCEDVLSADPETVTLASNVCR
jgi:hypothetical protein